MTQARIQLAIDGVQTVVGGLKQVGDKIGGVSKSIAGLTALGGALSVGVFTAWIKGAIDSADAVGELSEKTGIAAEDIAGIRLQFEKEGFGDQALVASMSRLSKGIVDGSAAFDQLGIKTTDSEGKLRSTKDVLYDVADQFSGMEAGAKKTALAVDLFGKSGADLIPMLNGGSEGMREMAEMAEKLGLVISKEATDKAGEFNDTLFLLQKGTEGVSTQIAAEMLPTLQSMSASFLESMTSGDKLKKAADFLSSGLKILYSVGIGIVEVFSTVGKVIGGVAAAAVAALSGNFGEAKNILVEMKNDIGAGWADTAKAISRAWDTTGNTVVAQQAAILKGTRGVTEETNKAGKAANVAKDEFAAFTAKLNAKESGTDADFLKNLILLKSGFDAGRISLAEYNRLVDIYIKQQPYMVEQQKAAEKATADEAAARKKVEETVQAQLSSAKDMLDSIQFETSLLSMNTAERELATRMRELEKAGVVEGTEAYKNYAETIKKAMGDKASVQAAIDEEADRKKTTDTLTDSITDGIMDGFRNGTKLSDIFLRELKAQFAKTTLRPLVEFAVSGGKSGGGGVLGDIFGAIGGSVGGGGGGSSALSAVNLPNALSFDGGGFTGSGARSGGLDGKGGFLAMMHPQETVIDHTKGQSASGGRTTYINHSPTYNISGALAEERMRQVAGEAAMSANADLRDRMEREGI